MDIMLHVMARQMYPGRVKFVQDSFKEATSVPYGYLLIDLKQETHEDLRLRNTIFPDDAFQYIHLTNTQKNNRGRVDTYDMSDCMKRHMLCLQMLSRKKNAKLKKTIIANADNDLICSIAECAYNILKGNVRLTPRQKAKLRRYRKQLRTLAKKGTYVACHSAITQTGGFLPALVAPLAPSVLLLVLHKLLQ